MKYENKKRVNEILSSIENIDYKLDVIQDTRVQVYVSANDGNTTIYNKKDFLSNIDGLNLMVINSIVIELKNNKKELLEELSKL